ncbi:FkbM family methyltransferase [Tautonia rosea]|uniref:FkbM family methyltransferase n=1 Tax=Tautonia rosea TaxID=2728037 RepID=UPI001475F152|nr:FkbM family methyltransferase [Tautonia rosea]
MMISYAQNAEDVLLNRVFAGRNQGFYIDVGAHDPIHNSVTKHFYEQGWSGINIEPEQETELFDRLQKDRPRDINMNLGLSNQDRTLTFYQTLSAPGWSTFSPAQGAEMARWGFEFVERSIPVTTLARVCEQHVLPGQEIDFLKVDAESHEREVIEGGDWNRWRPVIVLVEDNGTDVWEPLLLGVEYLFAAFDGINRYYVRSEDRQLLDRFAAPVNVTDEYVPFRYHRLHQMSDLGPSALRIARRLQDTANRHPKLARIVSRYLR